jgi:hypothetical protein
MNERTWRPATACALLAVSGLALGGCVSSPTYGTDKTANEQLIGDVTGILSLAPKKKNNIEYKPRPELVKPTKGEVANLPTPQESMAATSNPAWPESPEQKRARLRAEATQNRDKPGFTPEIEGDMPVAVAESKPIGQSDRFKEAGLTPIGGKTLAQQGAEVKQRIAANSQVTSGKRRYLSEPPTEYRQPSDTAPVGELGEDEVKKERRLKAQARKGKSSWADLWPF